MVAQGCFSTFTCPSQMINRGIHQSLKWNSWLILQVLFDNRTLTINKEYFLFEIFFLFYRQIPWYFLTHPLIPWYTVIISSMLVFYRFCSEDRLLFMSLLSFFDAKASAVRYLLSKNCQIPSNCMNSCLYFRIKV